MSRFRGRTLGTELHNPNFMKLAEAYGARGMRAEGPEILESSIRDAIAANRPTLIEVPVEAMPTPFEG